MALSTSSSPILVMTAPPGPWREFWAAFSANRGAVMGLVVIVVLLFVALAAPLIAPHAPNLTNSAWPVTVSAVVLLTAELGGVPLTSDTVAVILTPFCGLLTLPAM